MLEFEAMSKKFPTQLQIGGGGGSVNLASSIKNIIFKLIYEGPILLVVQLFSGLSGMDELE